MTAAWLTLAALVLLVVPGSAGSRRAAELARAGRLVASPRTLALWAPALGELCHRPSTALGAGLAVAVSVGAAAGPALACASGAVVVTCWRLVSRALAARAVTRDAEQTVEALQLVLAELAAGARVGAALGAAAGLGGAPAGPLAESAALADRGGDPSGPLLAAGGAMAAAGHAARVADVTGAALSEVLARVVADLVAARDQRRAAAVALAGPRSSAALLAGLPLLGIGLGAAMGSDPVAFLLASPGGRAVCTTGVLLDVAGVWWVAAVLRRAERG